MVLVAGAAAPGVAAAGDIIDAGATINSSNRFELGGRRLVRSNPLFKDVYNNSGEAGVVEYPWTSTGSFGFPTVLTPPVKQTNQYYGQGLAISGDFIAVSAPDWVDQNIRKGVVYVWTLVGDDWVLHSTLVSPAPSSESFGTALAMEGTTLVVGAARNDQKGADAGKGYFFRREGGNWVLEGEALPNDLIADDNFGDQDQTGRVAVHGDTAAFGVPRKDGGAGAVYVYVRAGQAWSLQAKVEALAKLTTDRFGHAVALQGDTLAVGAVHAKDANNVDTGALFVFERTNGTWAQKQRLVPANSTDQSLLGSEVELDGKWLTVSARQSDITKDNGGHVHVYRRVGATYEPFQDLPPLGGYTVWGSVQSLDLPLLLIRGNMNGTGVAKIYRIGSNFGDPCDGPLEDDECINEACVDDVCCDGACDLGVAGNCEACSLAAGSFKNGSCAAIEAAKQHVCRPAAADCDAAEVCTGGKTCPPDALLPDDAACPGGVCVDGVCEGVDTTGGQTSAGETSTTSAGETSAGETSAGETTDAASTASAASTSGGSTGAATAATTDTTQTSNAEDSTGAPGPTGGPPTTGDAPTSGPGPSDGSSSGGGSAGEGEGEGSGLTLPDLTGGTGADPGGCGCDARGPRDGGGLPLAAVALLVRRRRPRTFA